MTRVSVYSIRMKMDIIDMMILPMRDWTLYLKIVTPGI